jgi:penicillin-binding protein 1A
MTAQLAKDPESRQVMGDLAAIPKIGGLIPAAVVSASASSLRVLTADGPYAVPASGFAWAHLGPHNELKPGDIIRIIRGPENSWWLTQLPKVQGAMVALAPQDGAVRALVGGFDFYHNRFNRAVQMRRQIGSGFKPLLYAAALSDGYTPASVFLDAPVVVMDSTMQDAWRPEDDNGRFLGPMRLREALVHSRNLVSIRLLQTLGMSYVRHFLPPRFGISADRLPRDMTMALGTAQMSPWEVARAYAVFANGGYLVQPYFVNSIVGADGRERYRAQPPTICSNCPDTDPDEDPSSNDTHAPRVLDPQTTYLMDSMMHDVVVRGTGADAAVLGRHDLAGKTGTTNDESDAWFDGFNPQIVAVCWVGFDQPQSLGAGEYGARAALPIWIKFMRMALRGTPDVPFARPDGIIDIRVNPRTGKRLADNDPNGVPEMVPANRVAAPDEADEAEGSAAPTGPAAAQSSSETNAAQGLY